ncbi:hypothetical protein RJ641_023792, partial [Dillenia turbinata]
MSSRAGEKSGAGESRWSEILASEKSESRQRQLNVAVVYRRRRSENTVKDSNTGNSDFDVERRPSLPANKRVSWNRSLSTRGRTSIALAACVDNQPHKKAPRRRNRPALPKGKHIQPQNFDKERAYFQEVDSFALLEESPSPRNTGKWVADDEIDKVAVPHLSTVLQKWLKSKQLNPSHGASGSLAKILETPGIGVESICGNSFDTTNMKTPTKAPLSLHSRLQSLRGRFSSAFTNKGVLERHIQLENSLAKQLRLDDKGCEDIHIAVEKLSLSSQPLSLDANHVDPFSALLRVCGQSAPSTFVDVLSKFSDSESIRKVGEGTYGEAFKVGRTVCKIVPIDGDLRVNGEVQKRSEELLEEAILSRTLNRLRECGAQAQNSCTSFIETKDLKVCQGPYDPVLTQAWEDWDAEHGSENDHPKEFPEKQCYVVFVLEHGGVDLESFVLLNFDEVTAALAVAEAAYEFEHRDLHWGNILLNRKDVPVLQFTLEGKQLFVRTHGLQASIIDFTLSRINTGEVILFLDLSSDPELFEGPKGDKQSDTYRKMREVTEECWEESFPKTNVLWLQYLVDILLLKKSFKRTSKDERDLRSFKKRLNTCASAKEAASEPFFIDLFVDHTPIRLITSILRKVRRSRAR